MNFFYFALCNLCKKPSPNLKKCSHCRVPYYCSKAHQILDWGNHKSLCKAITNANKLHSLPANCTNVEFNEYKYTNSMLWKYELSRELEFAEQQMWMFPKACAVCFKTEVDIVCEECLTVAYCSQNHYSIHRDFHMKNCPELKLCRIIYETLCNEDLNVSWVKFQIEKGNMPQPDDLEKTVELLGYKNPHNFSKEMVDYVIMTEYFCPAINLIFPLEKVGIIERRQSRKSVIIIHVIGPATCEDKMSWILIVEYFSHWVYNLKSVKVYLVGPEVTKEETTTVQLKCAECRGKGFIATVANIKALYHDYVRFLPRADLIVAFNSGLHEFAETKSDTWKRTIPKMIAHRGVPTMLTAYTEKELKMDLSRFKESQITYVVPPQRNPYSSLRPNRNWEEGSEPVFYESGYIAVITKK